MYKQRFTISQNKLAKYLLFSLLFAAFMIQVQPVSAATIPPLPCDFLGDEVQPDTLRAGSRVRAEDQYGVVCGSCVVTKDRRYGFLSTYPDDPATPEKDGAIENDPIFFYLNGVRAIAEPDTPWSEGQIIRFDINVPTGNNLEYAYEFLYAQMGNQPGPRLIESYADPYPFYWSGDKKIEILQEEAYVYDNALSMIAFLVRGTAEDMRRAKLVGEAFVQLVKAEGPEDPENPRRIRDVYYVDTMRPTGRRGSGSGCGNMAWVINALLQYYKRDPYQPFFDTALELAQFVENEYRSDTGGYINGYAYHWGAIEKMTYKVSEQNIIVHAAFMRLYEIMKEEGIPGYNEWYERARWAKSFVTDEMWDSGLKMYKAGTGGEKVLDANCHAIMAFNDPVRNPQILNWLEKNVLMTCEEPTCGFRGFAFDILKNGVWFEGTSYMAMVYQLMNDIPNCDYYLSEVEYAQTNALGANGYGIVAACHDQVQTCFSGYELFSSPHIAATASYVLAKQGYNVLWMIPNGVNVAPLANAGEEQDVYINLSPPPLESRGHGYAFATAGEGESYVGTPVTLDGSFSWDCNNDPLTYNWTILQRPTGSMAELDDPNAINPTFTADILGDYIIELIVNDGDVASDPDTVTITAVLNQLPELNRPILDQTVDEYEELRFTVTATDPDGHIPIYSLEEVLGCPFPQDAFIDSVSGEFVWKPTFDDDEVYTVRIKVSDGNGGEDYEDITITVNDILVTRVGSTQTHTTIQGAIKDTLCEDIIYVYAGTYEGDVTLRDGKALIGENPDSTVPYPVILEGNIICMESDSTIDSIEIIYGEGSYLNYENLGLLADAGITAIDSEITVRNCIIMPQIEGYGKGIQIWNMYGSTGKTPIIENNLILKAETGIYLFSQAYGGAINGEIVNSTLDRNKYGITLRMHKENPIIRDNIITNCTSTGIMYTYEDGTLLDNRTSNVIGNVFFGNTSNIWCDSLPGEITPTGEGNIYQNPEYVDPLSLYYTPLNPACEGKGFALE